MVTIGIDQYYDKSNFLELRRDSVEAESLAGCA